MRGNLTPKDPGQLPRYSIRQSSYYLDIPQATLRDWVKGRKAVSSRGRASQNPLIQTPDTKDSRLSFENLVEAHVLRAIRNLDLHRVSMPKVRQALAFAEERLKIDRLLLHEEVYTYGGALFVGRLGDLINLNQEGQFAMRQVLGQLLERVDRDSRGIAQRLYPILPGHDFPGPKTILIDPRISFGQPILASTEISTADLSRRFRKGEGVSELAYACDIGDAEVEEALRFERIA